MLAQEWISGLFRKVNGIMIEFEVFFGIMTFNLKAFMKRALYLRQLQSKYITFYLFSLQGVSIL